MLKFIYTIFVGLLIVLFVGLGIDAFYPGPKAPEYPDELTYLNEPKRDNGQLSEEEKKTQQEYNDAFKKFNEEHKVYSRNVSIISVSIAVLILGLSIVFAGHLAIIADGAILGGVFTLIYAIIRGFEADDPRFRFIVTTVGLVVALVLGYIKFIRPQKANA